MKLEIIIKIIVYTIIYLISIYGAKQVNKYAYIHANASVIPISWFIPVVNTVSIFILIILMILSWLVEKLETAEYYKNKWNIK